MNALLAGLSILAVAAVGFHAGFEAGEWGGIRQGAARAYGTVTALSINRESRGPRLSLEPNLDAGRNPAAPPGP